MSDVKVKVTAETAALEAGLKKAKGDVDKFAKETEGAFTGMQSKLAAVFTVRAFVGAVKGAIDFAGAIKDTSDALSISEENLQGLQGAFNKSGVSSEQFGKAMTKLNESVQSARDGSESALESFGRLGIKWEDIRDKSPEDILFLISEGMKNAKNPTEALTAAMDLLGKNGKRMIGELKGGSDALREHADEISKLTTQEVESIDALGDAWDQLVISAKVGGGKFVREVEDTFNRAATQNLISGVKGVWNSLFGGGGESPEDAAFAARQAEKAKADFAMFNPGGVAAKKAGTASDPRAIKAAEEAAKFQEKEIEGIWKALDAEKKVTEERQKQLDQDAEEYDNLVKVEQLKMQAAEFDSAEAHAKSNEIVLQGENKAADKAEIEAGFDNNELARRRDEHINKPELTNNEKNQATRDRHERDRKGRQFDSREKAKEDNKQRNARGLPDRGDINERRPDPTPEDGKAPFTEESGKKLLEKFDKIIEKVSVA